MTSRPGPIERAVRKELVPAKLASPLGQAIIAAARRLDNALADDRDFATIAREFRAQLKEIMGDDQATTTRDGVDDLTAKRDARRAAASGESAP